MTTEVNYTCGYCDRAVHGKVVWMNPTKQGSGASVCPNCKEVTAHSFNHGNSPKERPAAAFKHLPDDVKAAWQEVMTSALNGAYTASEMMCRKILMHVAVDQGVSQPNSTFATYVNDLDAAHYFAPGLKPKIDAIRTRGNAANHELPASTEAEAAVSVSITAYLLRSVYELPNS